MASVAGLAALAHNAKPKQAASMKYTGERNSKSQRHGQGTETLADGKTYTGEFQDDNYHGLGLETYADGRTYLGAVKNGKFSGQGTLTLADGTKRTGKWKHGEPVP